MSEKRRWDILLSMPKRRLVLIVHNVRSSYNVGSMFRTADGLEVEKIYLCGYTPYPLMAEDRRLPHESRKTAGQINKTSLGAEATVDWQYENDITKAIGMLRKQGFEIAALEQTAKAMNLGDYCPPQKVAVIVGSEISGLDQKIIRSTETHLQIPMLGKKESLNVSVAAALALYHLRYTPSKRQPST